MTQDIPLPPLGEQLTCRGWQQEAALRCLLNNLHPEVAEDREQLIVYGGTGQAARDKKALFDIIRALKNLADDQTLLIQSGRPVAVMPSHPLAPTVLIANSNLVPHWAHWQHFNQLKDQGLMMYGQMTAGSWIYIGSQGILQGTYETFMAAAQKHYANHDLTGKWVLSAGMGGMGGAQPLAVKMAGGVFLGCDVDPQRLDKRIKTHYLDQVAPSFAEGLSIALSKKDAGKPYSVGVVGNAADLHQFILQQGPCPHLVTDQTSAHDPLNGYVPRGMSLEQALELRATDAQKYIQKALATMGDHVQAMLEWQRRGAHVFDYGNNLRAGAHQAGVDNAFDFPGFVPAYIRPLFCQGSGPFRWIALSGDPVDIERTDEALMELFPQDKALINWLEKAQKLVAFQGLPARTCWLRYGQREQAGIRFNQMVRDKKLRAPVVIGRDHLDCGSVASPHRETEGMLDGSDAVSDWPLLNALINSVNGASWVSFHHGGGVGIGYSQHAGMVICADGTPEMDGRLRRVLNSDPAMGIVRHADAGYQLARQWREKTNLGWPCH